MFGYFCKRILLIIPCVMAVILLIFIMMAALPGTDTARMVPYADDPVPPEQPLSFLQQYFRYCWRVFTRQDFGMKRTAVLPLRQELLMRTGATLRVMGVSLLATYLLGVPLGVYAACRAGSWQDSLITALTTLLSAVPAFCLSLGLMLIFAVRLQWVHVIPRGTVDIVIPICILTVTGASYAAGVTRAGMAEALEKPFILSLGSLGLSRRSIILRHGLKNALVPAFSVFSNICARLLCSSIVVERFFSIRGLGSAMIDAIRSRDTTSLLGCAVMAALIMSVCGVLTDLLYVLVNPSLRGKLSFRSRLRRGGR